MDSTVFTVAVIGCVVGAIFGVLVKHILDTRNYTEVCNWYLDEARKVDERDKIIKRLVKENSRLQIEVADSKYNKIADAMGVHNPEDVRKFFLNITDEPLPDHFNDDIDFGGKF